MPRSCARSREKTGQYLVSSFKETGSGQWEGLLGRGGPAAKFWKISMNCGDEEVGGGHSEQRELHMFRQGI